MLKKKEKSEQSLTKKTNLKITSILLGVLLVAVTVVGIFWLQSGSPEEPEVVIDEPEIVQEELEEIIEMDLAGYEITRSLREVTRVNMGFIWSDNLLSLEQEIPVAVEDTTLEVTAQELADQYENYPTEIDRLKDLIPAPEEPEKTNWLSMPDYDIEAPLIYGSFQDFFEQDPEQGKNIVNFSLPIQEDRAEVARGNYESVPVQRLLRDGVFHLPFSTYPGEFGHSFIVGHSSNFSVVQSDYNEIFKSIERTSQSGDIFYIYDFEGRKMEFEVFEAIEILEEDVATAYRTFPNSDFPDKDRVVTLQGSILENVGGRLEPTKRWLTRGQLVNGNDEL